VPAVLRPFVIVALVALAGVLAMHGASADHHTELAHGASAAAAIEPHAMTGHDHLAHGHDGDDPCQGCGHNAAALCAFIVVAVIETHRRSTDALPTSRPAPGRPSLRTWSPDPPVPRFVLVPTT
jgi:hypothetical protein